MTTVQNNSPEAPPKRKDPPGVLCAKCEHLNPPGSTTCESCQASLFRTCPKCGKPYQQAYSRCIHCGNRDHHASPRRHGRRSLTPPNRLWWAYAAVLLALLALFYKVFQKVGNMNLGF